MSQCIDPFVGKILASWRYDISGIAPEMSSDYEAHLAQCASCHAHQRIHRSIDIALIGLATVSAIVCLLAFAVIHHFSRPNALLFEVGAVCGFAFSALVWLIVAFSTPAPMVVKGVVKDAAITAASNIHDRLPENLRERLPEEIRAKIAGSGN